MGYDSTREVLSDLIGYKYEKHRVLVTGGAGFIGSVLCQRLLDNKYAVTCFDSLEKGDGDSVLSMITHPDFDFVRGDITSESDVQRVVKNADSIIHLAGIVGMPSCKARPKLSYEVNVEGTRILMKYRSKNQRLVNSSTGSVYGALTEICTEESPLNPQSDYGIQKKIAEDIVSSAENTMSYRYATGFGVSPSMRVNLLVNDLTHQAVKFGAFSMFQKNAMRTFIPVKEMARALVFGLAIDSTGVYNCGAEEFNKTKGDIAEIIKALTNCVVFYGDYDVDPDLRDYSCSYEKLRRLGFHVRGTMEEEIKNLIKASPLINTSNARYA